MPTADEISRIDRRRPVWRDNPGLFIYEAFGARAWSKQVEIAESVRDNIETLVKSCHGVGKTKTASWIVLWFLTCFRPSKVITTAPTWTQVEKLLWSEIHTAYAKVREWIGGDITGTQLTLSPNYFAIGISPKVELGESDQGVRMQGFHSSNLLLIFDEGPGVNPALWEMRGSLLSSGNARFLSIGNPVSASGPFYEAYREKDTAKISMDIWDSPNFKDNGITNLEILMRSSMDELKGLPLPIPALATPLWARRQIEKWGQDSPLTQSRILSQFPTVSTDTLIPLAWLEACEQYNPQEKTRDVKVLGVDVARFGDDDTVIYGISQHKARLIAKWNGQDTQRTANSIIALIRDSGYSRVVIDDDGLGGGVTDRLNEWACMGQGNCGIIPFRNGAKPSDEERFYNARAEAYWIARENIKSKRISVSDEGDLFHQLTSIKYRFVDNGRIRLESKEDMKKRGLSSPDEADAFVMALWGLDERENTLSDFMQEGSDRQTAVAPWES